MWEVKQDKCDIVGCRKQTVYPENLWFFRKFGKKNQLLCPFLSASFWRWTFSPLTDFHNKDTRLNMSCLSHYTPIPVAARFKTVCGRSLAENAGSARLSVPCKCWLLSGRGLCFGLITRPEEFFWALCVWVRSWNLITQFLERKRLKFLYLRNTLTSTGAKVL